jgi:outer membrane protein assembly factor BamD (BamD/ComL family)
VAGALSRLQQLLDGYPASPLAQGALVRKFRLLASAGRSEEARHEAERYLAAYPTGFAVAEAEALKKGEGAVQQPPSAEEPEGP